MREIVIPLVALSLLLTAAKASDACYGGDVVIAAKRVLPRSDYLYGLSASFGGALPTNLPSPLPVLRAEPWDGCRLPGSFEDKYEGRLFDARFKCRLISGHGLCSWWRYAGKILLTARGNCTFVRKATEAQAAGAAALLVYSTGPGRLLLLSLAYKKPYFGGMLAST